MLKEWRKRRAIAADALVLESLKTDGAGGRWLIGRRTRLRAARLEPALRRLEESGAIRSGIAEGGNRIWWRRGQVYP